MHLLPTAGPRCSFCFDPAGERGRTFTSKKGGAQICERCVRECFAIMRGDEKRAWSYEAGHTPSPCDIKVFLDQFVIGQDAAKAKLVVAVYSHYRRILVNKKLLNGEEPLEKSNILLVGPTGSGKTLLAQTLAKMLGVPFGMATATTLTEAGYVGEDPENVLFRLIQNANSDIERAQQGIVYIDEIDKICLKEESRSLTRDVSGEGVQKALLPILEGTDARVPPKGGRKHPEQECISINTRDILFVCGGAFVGLEKIIAKRLGNQSLGFHPTNTEANAGKTALQSATELLRNVQPDDLRRFGFIPEFIGRLPVIATLDELDETALVKILTEPKNSLVRQFTRMLELEDITLSFEKGLYTAIARKAIKRGVGARGLRAVMEELMHSVLFNIDRYRGMSVTIINAMLEDPAQAPVVRKRSESNAQRKVAG